MNLKEYAEKEGITIKEAKVRTGLTHWKQEVIDAEKQVQEKPKEIEAKKEVVQEEVDPAIVELSIRCLGSKSKYWKG